MRELVGIGIVAAISIGGLAIVSNAAMASTSGGRVVGSWPAIIGAAGTGGYIVYSTGKVVVVDGAPNYGSFSIPTDNVVGFAENAEYEGYWVVTSTGKIYGTKGVCGSGDELKGVAVKLKAGESIVGAISGSSYSKDFALVTNTGQTFQYACRPLSS
jgi:hypothetical protein